MEKGRDLRAWKRYRNMWSGVKVNKVKEHKVMGRDEYI